MMCHGGAGSECVQSHRVIHICLNWIHPSNLIIMLFHSKIDTPCNQALAHYATIAVSDRIFFNVINPVCCSEIISTMCAVSVSARKLIKSWDIYIHNQETLQWISFI